MNKKLMFSDQPLQISKSDFLNFQNVYRTCQPVQYQCEKCNRSTISRFSKVWKSKELLCTSCRRKKTKLIKYGDPNFNNPIKNRLTLAEHFGSLENGYKHQAESRKQTALKRYGVTSPNLTDEVKSKIKETWKNKTEDEYAEIAKKSKETNMRKYGCEYAFQYKPHQEKYRETLKRKYGSATYNNIEKAKQTLLERYGTTNTRKRYLYNDLSFDSSWELALWIYAKDHNEEIEREPIAIPYEVNGKRRNYYPDFLFNGKLIEIKNSGFIQKDGTFKNYWCPNSEVEEARHQAAIKANVEIWGFEKIQKFIKYVETVYGKNYLKSFQKKS